MNCAAFFRSGSTTTMSQDMRANIRAVRKALWEPSFWVSTKALSQDCIWSIMGDIMDKGIILFETVWGQRPM
jgi:RNase P/RNase MRP subunit p30